jgi:hypothetical protein
VRSHCVAGVPKARFGGKFPPKSCRPVVACGVSSKSFGVLLKRYILRFLMPTYLNNFEKLTTPTVGQASRLSDCNFQVNRPHCRGARHCALFIAAAISLRPLYCCCHIFKRTSETPILRFHISFTHIILV